MPLKKALLYIMDSSEVDLWYCERLWLKSTDSCFALLSFFWYDQLLYATDASKCVESLQNVKFDSSTGKMYEELGGSSTLATSETGVATKTISPAVTASISSAQISAVATSSASDYYFNYQSYPYSQQYMTGSIIISKT